MLALRTDVTFGAATLCCKSLIFNGILLPVF